MPTPPGQSVFQLRITLDDVVPTVWRRLLVPGSVRLAKLHSMFQAAMGWTDSHLHRTPNLGFRLALPVGTRHDQLPSTPAPAC